MAYVAKSEMMQLSQPEAEQYAKSIAMVARHYDVGASAKTLDWFNLLTVMGSIYGVRLMAVAEERRQRRANGGMPPGVRPNGHAASTAPSQPSHEGGAEIDFSLMTGRPH